MLRGFKIILNKASNFYVFSEKRLFFEFNTFNVIIDLKKSFNFKEGNFREHNEPILSKIKLNQIENFTFTADEYLGWRDDIIDYKEPISICNQMYDFLNIIKSFDSSVIFSFSLSTNEGYDQVGDWGFCGEPNYIFLINVESKLLEESSIELLIKKLEELDSKAPPKYYWQFYKRYKRIEDSGSLNIVSTNTKVRRIGYFKLLSDFLMKESRISEKLINRKFEEFVAPYNKELILYKNNKGIIEETKRGTSAKPYIETAKALNFIHKTNRVYSTGKLFKVYGAIQYERKNNTSNIFRLDKFDKLYFLEAILKNDFFYTSLLLEWLYFSSEELSYETLLNNFYPYILMRLNQYLSSSILNKGSKNYQELKKVSERITSWKKPLVYLEHILMPRINWLFDLELIKIDKNLNLLITREGKRLFQNICFWNDINWSPIINSNEFLNFFAVHTFDSAFQKSKHIQYEDDVKKIINNKIDNYVDISFKYFKTLAPNRVTSSQSINYTKYMLYLNDDLTVGYRYISNYLAADDQNRFIYKFQRQYGDGYIQRIKK
ncbi:MAG: hypothetical protein WD357_02015 [Gracilimonas sp.]